MPSTDLKKGVLLRPGPPASVIESALPVFEPAPELEVWAHTTFVAQGGALHNPDHLHLESARIGFVWTNVEARRQMIAVVGQTEIPKPPPNLGTWAKARWEYQISQWFGEIPDFLITLSAPYVVGGDDLSFAALVDHEFYHCAQRVDEFGCPKFSKDGRPLFGIKGHDVEEFVGIVRRYGPGAGAGKTAELVAAGKRPAQIARATVAGACGTCQAKVA